MHDFELPFVESLFDCLGDVVFCVKDRQGVYQSVNDAFVDRLDGFQKLEVVGKTAHDLFPGSLAIVFEEQDQSVFEHARPIRDQLERITNADGTMGWFLASKFPVFNAQQEVVGLVGISQNLNWGGSAESELAELKSVVEFIKQNLDQPLRTEPLANQFSLSGEQLDRRMKRVFRLSTKKFVIKCRLEEASRQLALTRTSVSDIALACGFSDQSAMTRQFRAATSDTPASYRKKMQASEE